MAGRNCFEMLGVEFDPPENIRKLKAAYEEWKKRLTNEQNTTVDTTRLARIKEELSMSSYIETVIDNPKFRAREAEELKRQRVEQLRLYIDLMRGDTAGTLLVTQAQMKRVREKLRLSLLTIEATYREQGFEVKKSRTKNSITTALNKFFLPDEVMNELQKNFAEFQKVPDPRNYPWSASVKNLYELAFHIERTEPNAESYQQLSCEELSDIFKKEAQRVAAPVPVWHSIKALLNLAQMQVFNSNENRYRYDHSLKLEILNKFFAGLKAAPDIFKRDPYFADNCISRIQNAFPNFLTYDLAVALYNKAAGLLNEPYESASNANETMFSVFCGNCSSYSQFRTREAAEGAVCPACGERFFTNCPKCGKRIPTIAEICPVCGCPISELKHLPQRYAEMNEYLSAIENEYRAAIENARKVDENAKFLMKNLTKLLADAKAIKADDPTLQKLEQRFNNVAMMNTKLEQLAWAKSKLPSLSAAPDKAVRDCMEILSVPALKTYRPAIERLRLIRPKKPITITAAIREIESSKSSGSITEKISVSGSSNVQLPNLNCQLYWQPDNDLGVQYQLVRKMGGAPINNKDGKTLLDKTLKIEFEDKGLKPGVLYGYSVFTTRAGAVSEPTSCEVVHYSDFDESYFTAKVEDGYCRFSWSLPSDACLGVRIIRSDNEGNSVIVADCVQSPFADRAVKSRKQYHYRLQCVYYDATIKLDNVRRRSFDREKFLNSERNLIQGRDFSARNSNNDANSIDDDILKPTYKYSSGVTVSLKPEAAPELLQNLTHSVSSTKVSFSWQAGGDFDVIFREVKTSPDTLKIGTSIKLSDLDRILGSTKILARVAAEDSNCSFNLNGALNYIAVISAAQSSGIISAVVPIASIDPCEIDRDKTSVEDGKLKLILRPLPKNLIRIHYAVNTKKSRGLYADVEDAKSGHMRTVPVEKYKLDKRIQLPSMPQTEIYLTVIGEYSIGSTTLFSNPSRFMLNNRPKSIINYWLEWGTSREISLKGVRKKPKAKNCKLIIESNADYTPKLYLSYNKGGGLNIEPGDTSTITLLTIKEYDDGLPDGRCEIYLPDSTWENIQVGTMIKLLPMKRDEKYFDVIPSRPETLKVPAK